MPPQLVDDLEEEVLLRFPPEEPAALVRASLVCKRWRRLVSGPGFRRRFREFHCAPPMLGMFCSDVNRGFVPTTAFRPRHAERGCRRALDARHGRVLLLGEGRTLVVWDPITGEERGVRYPLLPPQYTRTLTWTATVLCSYAGAGSGAGGCDHLDCHHGPFIVVFLRSVLAEDGAENLICTYSSDAAAWSEPIRSQVPCYLQGFVEPGMKSVLVGNALYFQMFREWGALKYDMQLRQMSRIELPSSVPGHWYILLARTEDAGLGVASAQESKLYIWSRKDADEVDAKWEQSRVIELMLLRPVDADFTSLNVVGSTDDLSIIFMREGNVVYAVDLNNYKRKKVCEGKMIDIIPYMSFYTPALEANRTGEGPSARGSSA